MTAVVKPAHFVWFDTFSKPLGPHFGAKLLSSYQILSITILDRFVIFNQAIADCYDYLTLIMTDGVITWASASSLKAFTRESSFSFSKAHWERRQLQITWEERKRGDTVASVLSEVPKFSSVRLQ